MVSRDHLLNRLSGRAADSGRADDTADVVARRLDIYELQTAPLLDLYRQRGLLREVSGTGSPDDVTRGLIDALPATMRIADRAKSA